MPRPRTHDEKLRMRLLDRAGELLSREGIGALSLRRLAADVGTSTTAVYSLFGGKPGLVREVYVEAFHRFGSRLRAVASTGDPRADVVALALAYRSAARADPHLYAVMFADVVPGFEPDEQITVEAHAALGPLVEFVRAGFDQGRFTGDDPDTMVASCWGLVHGMVALELNNTLSAGLDMGAAYEHALRAHLAGWTAPD